MANVFHLSYGDTRPVLEVSLKNPDGTPHNLTGATAVKLRILLSNGKKLVKDMEVAAPATSGVIRYTWLDSDWEGDNALIESPSPLKPGQREHRMKYEVQGAAGAKLSFPTEAADTLRISEAMA